MAKLTSSTIAEYRDHRLKTVSAGTIIRVINPLQFAGAKPFEGWSLKRY